MTLGCTAGIRVHCLHQLTDLAVAVVLGSGDNRAVDGARQKFSMVMKRLNKEEDLCSTVFKRYNLELSSIVCGREISYYKSLGIRVLRL